MKNLVKNGVLNTIILLMSLLVAVIVFYPLLVQKSQQDLVSTVDEIYEKAFNGQEISYDETQKIQKKYSEDVLQGLTEVERDRLDNKIRFIADAYLASQYATIRTPFIPVVVDLRNDPPGEPWDGPVD